MVAAGFVGVLNGLSMQRNHYVHTYTSKTSIYMTVFFCNFLLTFENEEASSSTSSFQFQICLEMKYSVPLAC